MTGETSGGWADTAGDYIEGFLGGATRVGNDVLNLRDRFRSRDDAAEQAPQVAPGVPAEQPQPTPAAAVPPPMDWQRIVLIGSLGLLALVVVLRAVK